MKPVPYDYARAILESALRQLQTEAEHRLFMRQVFGNTMAPIPRVVSMLQMSNPQDLNKVLRAALVRLQDEEIELVISEEDLRRAEHYTLVTTVIGEEGAVVLSVRPK